MTMKKTMKMKENCNLQILWMVTVEAIQKKIIADSSKITGHESDYMNSSDLGSYESISEDSNADDAKWHKSKSLYYDPNEPQKDFFF